MDALHRQYRYNALRRWKVPTVINVLPLMMHASVGLFLAGLVIVLWIINPTTARVVLALGIVILVAYSATALMPLFDPSCPYKSTALVLLQHSLHRAHITFWSIFHQIVRALQFREGGFSHLTHGARQRSEKALFGTWNRLRDLWVYIIQEGRDFAESPITFSKSHLVSARDHKRRNVEQRQIEDAKADLDIDAIFWLIKASGKQDLVDLGLLCLCQLKHQPHLVEKCLKGNVQSLLVRKAYLPLPSRDHDTWKKLTIATPENCLRDVSRLPSVGSYLQSLLFIWHHPSYFSSHPPSVISDSQVWDRPSYYSDNGDQPVLRMGSQSSIHLHGTAIEAPTHLFGDWLILWRSMKVASGGDLKWIDYRGWDLDTFALIVCTEAHYYQLKRGENPDDELVRQDVDDVSPYSDLYDLVVDYSLPVAKLDISDVTLAHVVDSYTYVISKSSSNHILLSTDSLIAILRLLTTRQLIYDNVLQKLILCLSMFCLPDWKRRAKAETYWKNAGATKYDRAKAYEQLSNILYTLRQAHLARALGEDGLAAERDKSEVIVKLTESLLFDAALEQDLPNGTYDEMFIYLPRQRAALILTQIATSDRLHEWRSMQTLGWMITLLYRWYDSDDADLGLDEQEQILYIFHRLLCFSWSRRDLPLICKKVLPFWASNLVPHLIETETEMANVTAKYACLTLRSMLHREDDQRYGRALVFEYEQLGLWDKVCGLLTSPKCTPSNRSDWARLRRVWKEDVVKTGWISTEEREIYSRLKEALPNVGTPRLGSSRPREAVQGRPFHVGNGSGTMSSGSGLTPTRQPIILRQRVDVGRTGLPVVDLTQPYSPPPSSRSASFQYERTGVQVQPGVS